MKLRHYTILALSLLIIGCGQVTVGDEVKTPNKNYGSTNGGVRVGENSHVGDMDSVNGGLRLGAHSQARNLDTVNGGIKLAEASKIRHAETVNGGISVDRDVIVEESLETVNGGIVVWPGSQIGGDVSTVNGDIEIHQALVGGNLSTSKGDIEVDEGSVIKGDIEVIQKGWNLSFGDKDSVRVVIGKDSVVEGDLTFKASVELFVHESAQIGEVEGAEVQRFSGSSPSMF